MCLYDSNIKAKYIVFVVGVVLCLVILPARLKRRLCLPHYKEVEHMGV